MKIRFSGFELDEERFLLERGGERVALRPKAFDLLVQLVRNRTRVMRREELVETLWNGSAVGSGSLSGLVNELRKALGESGLAVSCVRTVHARGYQFVAPVDENEVGDSFAPPVGVEGGERRGGRVPSGILELIGQVAEQGTRGVLLPPALSSGESREYAGGQPSPLEMLLAATETAGFEVCSLSVPDESVATPGRIARRLIDSMVGRRGAEAVRVALPLPARMWFEGQVRERVAGGFGPSTLAPPGGMGTVAIMLSDLARKRPLVCVLEGIDRAGPGLARDLCPLLGQLSAEPVLWVGTLRGGVKSGAAVRALEREAGFVPWPTPDSGLHELCDRLARLGHDPLPQALCEALGVALHSHVEGDATAVGEIARWLDRQRRAEGAPLEPSRGMHRVEPGVRSRAASGTDS